jgi:hypothetical protein
VGVRPAHLRGVRAALDEAALRRRIDRLADPALDQDGGALRRGIRHGHRGQERLRVWVLRPGEDLLGRAHLDDLAEVHHRDPVAHVAGDGEVVRDVEIRHPELACEPGHQLHDRDANAHVEHRGRLVGDDEARVHDQRAGDRHPLTLSTRELVRVAEEEVLRRHEADEAEEGEDASFSLGHRAHLLDHHRLADGVEDRAARVHRLVRVLEDHLRPTAVLLDLLALHEGDVALVLAVAEPDAAAGRLVQLHEHPARRRLAAPGLPDQSEALAGRDLEADAVDGVDEVRRRAEEPTRDRESHLEVCDLEERWPAGRLRSRLGDRARRRHRWRACSSSGTWS